MIKRATWVLTAIVLVLLLQTAVPLTHLPLLADLDYFSIVIVLFVCRLPGRMAYAACGLAGLLEDAFTTTPFGIKVLLSMLICAALVHLKDRLVVERFSCRFLMLVLAVLMEEIGGWFLTKLLSGQDVPLLLTQVLKEALLVGIAGALILSLVAHIVRRRRVKLAYL